MTHIGFVLLVIVCFAGSAPSAVAQSAETDLLIDQLIRGTFPPNMSESELSQKLRENWRMEEFKTRKEIELAQAKSARAKVPPTDYQKALDSFGLGVGSLWQNAAQQLPNLINGGMEIFKALNQSYVPDYDPAGMPDLPVHCEKKDGCNACYDEAYNALDRARMNLEKLRILGRQNSKFVSASISFGDSVAGIHPIAGLEWQAQRIKILKAQEEFQKIYKAKYVELIAALENALRKLSVCEEKHFGFEDWYDRFGFLFLQSARMLYVPAD